MADLWTEEDDPLLGTDVAGYRIEAVLGRGGMGSVYRAVQPLIGARVAIKVLASELLDDPAFAERFVDEARLANRVTHDGLVKIFGIGVLGDGRPYLLMEYLVGRSLAAAIDDSEVGYGSLCRLVARSLDGLAALHQAGIVHRDLKPSNLFVTDGGDLKLLDFGIAKAVVGDRKLTATGTVLGTPEYMSPEQAAGETVGAASDIYSIGAMLYECIAGKRAFEGHVIAALAHGERPPRLRDVPSSLDEVVQTAMAPLPGDRFPTAQALAAALTRALDDLPATAFSSRPPTAAAAASNNEPSTVVERAPRHRDPEGRRQLGRFVIEREIGSGGFGRVFAGRDPAVERKVALKLVRPGDPEHRRHMVAEARAMAQINHPNIVTLYELNEDGDQMFIAMELVDGVDLERWLASERRQWRDIVERFVEAGQGLAAAHAAGVVHRDFKPANVLVGRDGRTRVGDFGIAVATGTGSSGAGTPAFVAPEILAGSVADPRADQYAFAAALWHALHGEPPYSGDHAVARAMAAERGKLARPRDPAVSEQVNRALARALAADPSARFPAITDLLAALTATPVQRRMGVRIAVLGVLATLIVPLAWYIVFDDDEPRPPRLSFEQIARLTDSGEQLRALSQLPPWQQLMNGPRQLANDARARGFTEPLELAAPARAVALSPGGRTLVALEQRDGQPTIELVEVATRVARELPAPTTAVERLAVDDDGAVRALTARGIERFAGGSWQLAAECQQQTNQYHVGATPRLMGLACGGPRLRIFVVGGGREEYPIRTARVAFASEHLFAASDEGSSPALSAYDRRLGNGSRASIPCTTDTWAISSDHLACVGDGKLRFAPLAGGPAREVEATGRDLWLVAGDHPYAVVHTRKAVTLFQLDRAYPPSFIFDDTNNELTVVGNYLVGRSDGQLVARDLAGLITWRTKPAALVAASSDGRALALVDDRAVRMWQVGQQRPAVMVGDYPSSQATRNALHTTHTTNTTHAATIERLDLTSGRIDSLTTPFRVRSIQASPTASYVASADSDQGVKWPLGAGTTTPLPMSGTFVEVGRSLFAVTRAGIFSTADRRLVCEGMFYGLSGTGVAIGITERRTAICNVITGTRLPLDDEAANSVDANALWTVAPDGRHAFAIVRQTGVPSVIDTATGKIVSLAGMPERQVTTIRAGGERWLVASAGSLIVIDSAGSRQLATAAISAADLDESGRYCAAVVDGELRWWDLDVSLSPRQLGNVLDSGRPNAAPVKLTVSATAVVAEHFDGTTSQFAIWWL